MGTYSKSSWLFWLFCRIHQTNPHASRPHPFPFSVTGVHLNPSIHREASIKETLFPLSYLSFVQRCTRGLFYRKNKMEEFTGSTLRENPCLSPPYVCCNLFLFCRDNTNKALCLLHCLETYQHWSGQQSTKRSQPSSSPETDPEKSKLES